ncbi:hypothetical protein KSP39_PZI020424 [Platanthera zijinensis]|uniref:Uncharacterized protein n=1 Tax=Platanthera zijinensis TaxID=2320716 RepID=A0AAP0AZ41_9ASPA
MSFGGAQHGDLLPTTPAHDCGFLSHQEGPEGPPSTHARCPCQGDLQHCLPSYLSPYSDSSVVNSQEAAGIQNRQRRPRQGPEEAHVVAQWKGDSVQGKQATQALLLPVLSFAPLCLQGDLAAILTRSAAQKNPSAGAEKLSSSTSCFVWNPHLLLAFIILSPKKVNLVAKLVRGMRVEDALLQLQVLVKRAAKTVYEVIHSARANASHNHGLDPDKLIVGKHASTVSSAFSPRRSRFPYRNPCSVRNHVHPSLFSSIWNVVAVVINKRLGVCFYALSSTVITALSVQVAAHALAALWTPSSAVSQMLNLAAFASLLFVTVSGEIILVLQPIVDSLIVIVADDKCLCSCGERADVGSGCSV